MNISPKYFLLGMAVGFVIIVTFATIGEIKQEDLAMVMGVQDEHTPMPTLTPTLTPTSTPTPTPKPTVTPTPVSTATPTPEPTATPAIVPIAQPFDPVSLVSKYAGEYGVDEQVLYKIGQCESGFNTTSANGPYGGIYQFHFSTWASTRIAMGLDPNPDLRFNPEESIRTAAYKIANGGVGAWPACSSGQ